MKTMNIFKKAAVAAMVVAMLMCNAMPAMAAGWQKNNVGWWYATNDAGTTWYANEWQWIDGNGDGIAECYCFDGNGYMYENTTTPDGYTVNADGAWTENGVVQIKIVGKGTPVGNTGSTGGSGSTGGGASSGGGSYSGGGSSGGSGSSGSGSSGSSVSTGNTGNNGINLEAINGTYKLTASLVYDKPLSWEPTDPDRIKALSQETIELTNGSMDIVLLADQSLRIVGRNFLGEGEPFIVQKTGERQWTDNADGGIEFIITWTDENTIVVDEYNPLYRTGVSTGWLSTDTYIRQ